MQIRGDKVAQMRDRARGRARGGDGNDDALVLLVRFAPFKAEPHVVVVFAKNDVGAGNRLREEIRLPYVSRIVRDFAEAEEGRER